MTDEEITEAYAAMSAEAAEMLGTAVTAEDPDRAVIEPWARTVPGRILDLGSGTGRWTGHLVRRGHDVEGLEPVRQLVDIARSAHPAATFRQGRLEDLADRSDRWSGILAWYSLIHVDPAGLPAALAALGGALEADGTVLMSYVAGPRVEPFAHPIATAYRWPPQEMARALRRAGFEVTGAEVRGAHAWVTARRLPSGT
ncbi:class I SAM-dependent methyltransferase [Brachybacterium vulturis]|uniref:class I SAM-dependent methyltransferase n=1 Tax=Brachybacterium vulturis TaxID=2017484 RepID=UPI003736190A